MSITDGSRTVNYTYQQVNGKPTLSKVTLPDSSAWELNLANLSQAFFDYSKGAPGEPYRDCINPGDWIANTSYAGSIKHPSGAIANFTFAAVRHGRTNVPDVCFNLESPVNNPNNDIPQYPSFYDTISLTFKSISGPGLPGYLWKYQYTSNYSIVAKNSPCFNGGCVGGLATTSVTQPDGESIIYYHGNSFRYDEGKLRKVVIKDAQGIVRETKEIDYQYGVTRRVGQSPQQWVDSYAAEYLHPTVETRIVRDAVTFKASNTTFDTFARPTSVTRSNTIGYSVNETIAYHDNLSKWVLGQTARTTTNGMETSRSEFDANALPTRSFRFGKLQSTLAYWPDGNLKTVTDGRGNTTTLADYFRGVPRAIAYPDGTGHTAVVDGNGWISSVTDQLGHTTNYQYDPMGRLSRIDYPAGDSNAWAPVTLSFSQVNTADRGLPAGHWQRRRYQGNRLTISYLDALWRPVFDLDLDVSDNVTWDAQRIVTRQFDHDGRTVFESYPTKNIGDYKAALPGTRTEYDALGRVTKVVQDSELGPLTTTTQYLSGFQTLLTDPKGNQTQSGYWVLDQPSYELPGWIRQPEGKVTEIFRDAFAKPSLIRRRNADGTQTLDRHYVYDANQQLCKRIDPEAGATVMDYDAAGNVQWYASGLALTSTSSCDTIAGRDSGQKTTHYYDAMNRLTLTDYPGSAVDISYAYEGDGLLKQITAGPSTWKYSYNKRRLLMSERHEDTYGGNVYPETIGWSYDGLGNRASMTAPTGVTVDYAPNALGQATRAGNFATNAKYHANGALQSFTYGNGIVRTFQQNTRQLLSRILDQPPQPPFKGAFRVPVMDEFLTYDANANLTALADEVTGNGGDRDMQYDALDRLTYAHIHYFNISRWKYDVLDNITSHEDFNGATTTLRTYNYDSKNRLSSVTWPGGAWNYGFDARGNITARSGYTHVFDEANRLRSSPGRGSYQYDGHGRRTRTDRADGTTKVDRYSTDGVIRYTNDTKRSGSTTYVHLAGQLVAEHFRNWSGPETITYVHTDGLGSPALRTDQASNPTERERSFSFGRALDGKKQELPGFTGHMEDPDLDLTYMQQRYYDPAIGRFISVDPVDVSAANGSNFNRYWYANNNPYRYTDPDGRESMGITGTANVGPAVQDACGGSLSCQTEVAKDIAEAQVSIASASAGGASLASLGRMVIVKIATRLGSSNLPKNPNDLAKRGYKETSHPKAAEKGHRTFENPKTGDKLRHDQGKPGKPGHEGKDHYHRENPNATGKQDQYLDKSGNGVARGSDASHLYPKGK